MRAICAMLLVSSVATGNLLANDESRPAQGALRAIYLHLAPFADPQGSPEQRKAKIGQTLDVIQACGFSTVLAYANSSGGRAYYPSQHLMPATAAAHETLAQVRQGAQSRGLRVMPVVCVLVSGHDDPAGILQQHPDWALRDEQGNPLGWISPAHPAARQWIVVSIVELVESIGPDGLLLDYFRYPNRRDVHLDAKAAEEFDRAAPPGETTAARQQRLQRVKEESLTLLLGEIRDALRAKNADLSLGLYTWGAHVAADHPVAQPWPKWVAAGQIDVVNVSGYCYRDNYGDDYLRVFERRLRDASAQIDHDKGRALLTFALGLRTSHGAIPAAAEIADYLNVARQVGIEGVAAFAWNGLEPLADEVVAGGFFKQSNDGSKTGQSIRLRVDLGPDRGQNFGTLFEAFDADGQAVAGAGFLGAYNTYYQADRHTLQVFVRPVSKSDRTSMTSYPRPSDHTLHYMSDIDGQVVASDRRGATFELQRGDGDDRWQGVADAPAAQFRIADKVFQCEANRITCDHQEVFRFDRETGTAGSYYYAQGTLIFHVALSNSDERRTRLVACPWDPATEARVDLDRAIVLELSTPGEFPYSFGQHGDDVIVGTNTGGVYRLRAGAWQMLLEPDMATSFQLYAMLNYHDRLLMGHYPSGELFELVEDKVQQVDGWPPRPQGASPRAREAQTLTLYRGELYVGVWPWGEVWRRRAVPAEWEFVGRLFERPEMRPEVTAPYEAALSAGGVAVNNLWGQRVTSLIPTGEMLLASTSNKGGTSFEEHAELLSADDRREYGQVFRLTLPGHLSIPLAWHEGSFDLEFSFGQQRVTIREHDRELGTIALPAGTRAPELARIECGQGVFGPFRGRDLRGTLDREE